MTIGCPVESFDQQRRTTTGFDERGLGCMQVRRACKRKAECLEVPKPAKPETVRFEDVRTRLSRRRQLQASMRIEDDRELHLTLTEYHPGDQITVGIVNANGEAQTLQATLKEGPPA